MIQAMYSGISGMKAFKGALDVIGNNIANINTTSYKAGRASFKDMLSQTISGATAPSATRGGVNASQVGLGVTLGSIDQNMTGGSMQSTSRASDLAIEGNGYFILGDGSSVAYTRDGSFSTDAEFNLVGSSGKRVLGWAADFNTGLIDTSVPITSESALNIPIGGLSVARATSKINLAGNLDASSQGPKQTTTARITGNLNKALNAKATSNGVIGGTLNSATATGAPGVDVTFNVYDNNGTAHSMTVNFQRTAANTWDYGVTSAGSSGLPATRTAIGFDPGTGAIDTASIALPGISWGGGTPISVTLDTSGLSEAGATTAALSSQDGLAPSGSITVPYNVYDSLGTAHPIVLTFTKAAAADTWSYNATSADGTISGIPATPTVTFNSSGAILGSLPALSLTLTTPNGSDSPLSFTPNVSALTQNVGTTTATMSSQDGSAPGKPVEIKYDIYDSLGLTHKMRVVFNKTSDPATWDYSVICDDASVNVLSDTGAVSGPNGQIKFNELGYSTLDKLNLQLTLTNANGSTNPILAELNTQNISQLNGATTVDLTYQDGLQLGTLESYGIGKDGVITGTFTNGSSRSLGKIAMAQFNNSAGLTKVGNNAYAESPNSGTAKIGEAGTGGLGAINSNFLEASNVDLATEFANMIVAQRGFQATSKIITTSDEVLQELVNLKR